MKKHKKQGVKVADSEKRAQARLNLKNKGFALVCSLLRGVWNYYEAPGPKWQDSVIALKGAADRGTRTKEREVPL